MARPTRDARSLALVGVGGALGTLLRWAVERTLPAGVGWPWGTFAVNVVGSLILGFLLERLSRAGAEDRRRQRLRLALGTGFCGGLTTYSTFALELGTLLRAGSTPLASGYALASVLGGLLAAAAGVLLAGRRRPGPRP
ncbi:fluoride efflux transporter CrcB [Kineococcus gynurae]|uniref:Fluoride-specific ion channel FluC n=1 Tax=Kineococcus gynurae TaxID=452979 RepID=A0ABV5LSP3_9ACTN